MATRSLIHSKGLRRRSRFEHPWAALAGIVIALAGMISVDSIRGRIQQSTEQREAASRPGPVRIVEVSNRTEPSRDATASSSELAVVLRTQDGPAIPIDPRAEPVAVSDAPPASVTATPPPRPPVDAVAPRYAGLWASHPAACLKKTAGTLLPLKISQDVAAAGKATCRFGRIEEKNEAWKIVARCTNNGETWTATVRITLQGDRLTWSSERGTQTYRRCERSVFASAT